MYVDSEQCVEREYLDGDALEVNCIRLAFVLALFNYRSESFVFAFTSRCSQITSSNDTWTMARTSRWQSCECVKFAAPLRSTESKSNIVRRCHFNQETNGLLDIRTSGLARWHVCVCRWEDKRPALSDRGSGSSSISGMEGDWWGRR